MDNVGRRTPSEPIALANVPDFMLGVLQVQPALRRVSAGGAEESVEPRVMQALVALVQAGGAVVSRDALIDRCWAGRIVGEDAINRCIAKVRKLAEATEPPAFSIDTVAKVGYRLKVTRVAHSEPGAIDGLPAEPRHAPPQARIWLPWISFGLLVIAGASAGVWRLWPRTHWMVQSSHRLLPNLEGETNPRISPNGSMLAYVVKAQTGHGRIFVRNLQGGTSEAVSSPEDNADSPAWAADSTHLAYVAVGQQSMPCRIMVTSFPGGTPYVAGRCRKFSATDLAWQPASSTLFFEENYPPAFSGIFRLDTETGESQPVTSPPPNDWDEFPRVSPDGEWLAYTRARGFPGRTLRLRRLASGEEREILCEPDTNAIDWTPDSRAVIASVSGDMGSDVLAYPIDGAPAYRVYASASPIRRIATGPNGVLAAELDDGRRNLARAHTTPIAEADVIDPAAGITDWPAFAPDGTLAFVSNRSGRAALWTRKPGGQPLELHSAGFKDIERPVWSPDGSRIAFFEVWKGNVTVHVITGKGEQIAAYSVPSIGFGMPNWTPDGEHLITFDRRIMQAVQVDLRDPDHRVPVTGKYWDAITYRQGATYSARGEKPGIWQLDGGPRLITPDYPAARDPRLAFVGNDVLLPGPIDGETLHILAQPLTGAPPRPAYFAPSAEPETPFAVDPLTGDVIYVSAGPVDNHIDLLTLARQ